MRSFTQHINPIFLFLYCFSFSRPIFHRCCHCGSLYALNLTWLFLICYELFLMRFSESSFSEKIASQDYKDCSKLLDEAMCSFSGLLYVCIVFALQTWSLEKFRKLLLKLSFMYDIVIGNRYTFVEEVSCQIYHLVNLVYVCLKLAF